MDNQTAYWNGAAATKVFTHPLDEEQFLRLVPRHARILDFGCGYGRTCSQLDRLGYVQVMGVDTAAKMIERGRREYPHLDLRTLGAAHPPWEADVFDAVLLLAVLTCIPSDTGQKALMAELKRILRPGGILYLSDYWLQTDRRNHQRYERFQDKYGRYGIFELPEGVVVRHHDRDWIRQLLADFAPLSLADREVTTMNGHATSGFQYFGRKKET